ncbi:putative transcriptional regulator [Pseudomonas aeruginosa PA99]|nr:putative transcriptional regulator [Pseudomonas aeruginosa PA99]
MRLATDAGLLVAAERGVGRVQVVAVGPHATGLDPAAHAVGAVDVAGPEAGAEAVLGVVGDGQGLGFVLEGGDADHRAEDFLLEHAHAVVPLEQGRLDVVAAGQVAFELLDAAAGEQLGAFLLGDVEVGEDLLVLLLGSLGADHGLGVQRVAALDRPDLFQHLFHERRVDRLLDQRAGRAGAHLALVEESQHQALGGLLDERRLGLHDVFEIDVRALAAQLDGGGNDVLRRALEDVRADRGGTGEGDLGDALAGGQGLAGLPAEALDDVEHARRQQVADEFQQHADAQRGLLGRLEHHAVAGGQRRGQLPGGHQQREVPRDDLPDHAQRLMDVVGHGAVVDLGGGAFLGADAAGEVAEVVGGQGNVGVEGLAHGLAVVPGLGDGEQFQVLLDAVGDLQQDVRTLLHRGAAPGLGGGVGGVEGLVDVLGGGTGELGDRLAVHRRGVGEVLALDRRHELAADVVAVARLEGDDGTGGSGRCVDHGEALLCGRSAVARRTRARAPRSAAKGRARHSSTCTLSR